MKETKLLMMILLTPKSIHFTTVTGRNYEKLLYKLKYLPFTGTLPKMYRTILERIAMGVTN